MPMIARHTKMTMTEKDDIVDVFLLTRIFQTFPAVSKPYSTRLRFLRPNHHPASSGKPAF